MKNVVITGANRGIGLAMAEKFSALGYQVFAVCREASTELTQANLQIIDGVDVATEQGLTTLFSALKNINIDILINNAGVFKNERLGAINTDDILQQFTVNALAPLKVVDGLRKQLMSGAKIAMITSRMGSISDNGSGEYYGYRMSKCALNAAAMSLTRDLASEEISVGIYHPGWVQTQMVNNTGDISAAEAAEKLCTLIMAQDMSNTGSFKHSNGDTLPW